MRRPCHRGASCFLAPVAVAWWAVLHPLGVHGRTSALVNVQLYRSQSGRREPAPKGPPTTGEPEPSPAHLGWPSQRSARKPAGADLRAPLPARRGGSAYVRTVGRWLGRIAHRCSEHRRCVATPIGRFGVAPLHSCKRVRTWLMPFEHAVPGSSDEVLDMPETRRL